ncbi:LpqB family beta-propeller domain-containing protein [Thermomonospora umbrina]|uniref:Sporulation and spore germination protein n=1 Tax=Thermomonospora umbrina TaxID=111806 RepID=A0A3D9SR94_9ACTN|nr:LpqB family beta-propeller domain-containing protein [Thermomonospora umbrina]REE98462.1 sporulation and spore germination protein [Thermomonospora umbrina]
MRSRRAVRILGGVVALACLAGCASVPSGGRVVSGRSAERAEPIAEPYVRLVPVRPRHNWTPDDIVKGFLTAAAGFNNDHEVAREYLTPTANASWRPGPRPEVIVTESAPSLSQQNGGTLVQVAATRLGHIASDGQYTAQSGTTYVTSFGLVRDANAQWRINRVPTELQRGLLLSGSDVDRAFRVLNLYFFEPDGNVLVPNGISLPLVNRQELPRQLVQALLAGPTTWLKPAVRSFFPAGTRLRGISISEGIATVDLSSEAHLGGEERMAAQLTWTLQRLPEVRQVKMQIDGDTIDPGGLGQIQSAEEWERFNSDTSRGRTEEIAYLRGADGRPHQLLDNDAIATGTKGDDHLYRPALSSDRLIAGLDSAGDTVLSGDLLGGVPVRPVLEAQHPDGRLTPPSWDHRGALWTVESFRTGSTLWVRPEGRQPIRVARWELSGHEVLALRVARDGVRVAVIVKIGGSRQLRLGRIVRSAGGVIEVGRFLPISSELVDAVDLAWSDSSALAVLGRTKATATQVTPYSVPVSGGSITPIGSGILGEAKSITAAPNSRIIIGAENNGKNSICRQSNLREWRFGEWNCDPLGSDPTYWG